MIGNKLQYYKTYAAYKAQKDADNIPNDAIIFVQETGQIFTHNNTFGGNITTTRYGSV